MNTIYRQNINNVSGTFLQGLGPLHVCIQYKKNWHPYGPLECGV